MNRAPFNTVTAQGIQAASQRRSQPRSQGREGVPWAPGCRGELCMARPGGGKGLAGWRNGGKSSVARNRTRRDPQPQTFLPVLRSARGVQRRWVEHDAAQSERLLSGQGQGLGPGPSDRPEPARLARLRELRGAPAGPSAWPWARRFSPDSRLQIQRPCEGRVRVSSSVCPLLFSAFRCLSPPPP